MAAPTGGKAAHHVPYSRSSLGKEKKRQLEEEAAVLCTAQTLDLRTLLEVRLGWTNRKQACSADRTIKADPDNRTGRKLQEDGVVLTCVLLWANKASLMSVLHSGLLT